MVVRYSKVFIKQVKKISPELRQRLNKRISTFTDNPLHPSLRNHSLSGKYKNHRSIDITGDLRAIYLQQENDILFKVVSTHSQLYG